MNRRMVCQDHIRIVCVFYRNIAVAILRMREKIATGAVMAGRSVDIGFETSEIGNILQAFAFLDGERPLCRDKATKKRKVFACDAAQARSIFRYPDIGSVSPHDVLASSWDTHPLFMEFIIRPQPALSPHRELPGDHLTGDSAVSTMAMFYRGTLDRGKILIQLGSLIALSFAGKPTRDSVIGCHRTQ